MEVYHPGLAFGWRNAFCFFHARTLALSRKRHHARREKKNLRKGFSTGTAVTAAARAALRYCLTGKKPRTVAVRLPAGYFIPVAVDEIKRNSQGVWASVVKDAGDDPDVTHHAQMKAHVRLRPFDPDVDDAAQPSGASNPRSPISSHLIFRPCLSGLACGPFAQLSVHGIRLIGGTGVGKATRPGLPVQVGEPAINPTPRAMLLENLEEELARGMSSNADSFVRLLEAASAETSESSRRPWVFLPFSGEGSVTGQSTPSQSMVLEVEVEVPKGAELARRTLNPRLGVVDGISILGTTGIVRPFSHEAYEETIEAALSVAASNGCTSVVLSTGGKSEKLARALLPRLPEEAFVQIADFFAFAVKRASGMGFGTIHHSVFFGKAVKMAQGHPYTHAHKVPLDLEPTAKIVQDHGHDPSFCREIASANTARHALELLLSRGETRVVETVARQALEQSARIAGNPSLSLHLLLFDYEGNLLARVRRD
jgi:cobalt-precorrin-5B (C1)-methyltransferase